MTAQRPSSSAGRSRIRARRSSIASGCKRYGIDGDYVAEAVPPDAIEAFLGGFADSGYVGGNVTLPHKEAAFRACRRHDADRRGASEAANTLWLEGGATLRRQHRRLRLPRQSRRARAGLAARLARRW